MSESPVDRVVMRIASLRLAVGMLGERDTAGWWNSCFFSPSSAAFLAPIFGGNVLQARYQGVVDAARRVHDERIGVGQAFHLFRLPENLEQHIFEALQSSGSDLTKVVSSADSARLTLDGVAIKATAARSGPALVVSSKTFDSDEWVGEAASLYAAAFGAGVQCFPYIAGAR